MVLFFRPDICPESFQRAPLAPKELCYRCPDNQTQTAKEPCIKFIPSLTKAKLLVAAGLLTTPFANASFILTDLVAYDPTFGPQCNAGTVAPDESNPCEYTVVELKRG